MLYILGLDGTGICLASQLITKGYYLVDFFINRILTVYIKEVAESFNATVPSRR